MIPAQWLMPASVLGLVIAAILAAGLVSRYQQYKAFQRARLKRVATPIGAIERGLNQLGSVPLSKELRQVLRGDVLRRYQAVARLHRGYPRIERLLAEARARLDSEGAAQGNSVPAIEDETRYKALVSALEDLIVFFEQHGPLEPLGQAHRRVLMGELKERRAEVWARYHIVAAHRASDASDPRLARQHLHALMSKLKTQGPNTDFVRALYQEAEQLRASVLAAPTQAPTQAQGEAAGAG